MTAVYYTLRKDFDSVEELKRTFYGLDEVLKNAMAETIKKHDFKDFPTIEEIRAACYYSPHTVPNAIVYLEAEISKRTGQKTIYLGIRHHNPADFKEQGLEKIARTFEFNSGKAIEIQS